MALCLSGGGYRAMLFHVGAICRLNELGLLRGLKRISSASGGSVAAAQLGLVWKQLAFDATQTATNLDEHFVNPVRKLASHTIDVWSVLAGAVVPWTTAATWIARAYAKHLFGAATLQDLPADDEGPRFVINATNAHSGVLWRFMRPYMRDYRVGEVKSPAVPLALAVAASSAFPPFLSPVDIALDPASFTPGSGSDLQRAPFTSGPRLTDGGVYDNLALQAVVDRYDTVLVSDGGGHIEAEARAASDWPRHTYRVLQMMDSQVRALRVRALLRANDPARQRVAYWSVRSDLRDYPASSALAAPLADCLALAATPTRLSAIPAARQEALINWGYAAGDVAVRSYVETGKAKSPKFPYPRGLSILD